MANGTLVYCGTKETFETKLADGEIADKSIVFIGDTGEIWTHGGYYGGGSGGIVVGTDEDTAEDGYIFIDEDDTTSVEVYTKSETDAVIQTVIDAIPDVDLSSYYTSTQTDSKISTAVSNIKTQMPIVRLIGSGSSTLSIGNFYVQTLSSTAVTYTLPTTGAYTATSASSYVEHIFVEFTAGSGSITFNNVIWPNEETPTFDSGTTYQISLTAKYTSGSTIVWLAAVSQSYKI